jgi:hypothetical protein
MIYYIIRDELRLKQERMGRPEKGMNRLDLEVFAFIANALSHTNLLILTCIPCCLGGLLRWDSFRRS